MKLQLRKRLDHITWSDLRRFGTNRVLKSSYWWLAIVPIAAKILLQFNQPFVFTFFGKEHTIFFRLPFSWYLFYFAAVAFAIASGLFSLFCPKMIKRNASFADFYRESSGAQELLEYYFSLDKDQRNEVLPQLALDARRALGIQDNTRPSDPTEFAISVQTQIREVKREEMTDLFSILRRAHDAHAPKVRIAVVLAYSIGFVLITIVGLQNFAWVCRVIFH
jgi:hypothetical protein